MGMLVAVFLFLFFFQYASKSERFLLALDQKSTSKAKLGYYYNAILMFYGQNYIRQFNEAFHWSPGQMHFLDGSS
jgi:hypothetical protein